MPVEGYPPDSLYLEIIGTNFQVIPETPNSYDAFNMTDGSLFRYYKIKADFKDNDSYNVTGYVECKISLNFYTRCEF